MNINPKERRTDLSLSSLAQVLTVLNELNFPLSESHTWKVSRKNSNDYLAINNKIPCLIQAHKHIQV